MYVYSLGQWLLFFFLLSLIHIYPGVGGRGPQQRRRLLRHGFPGGWLCCHRQARTLHLRQPGLSGFGQQRVLHGHHPHLSLIHILEEKTAGTATSCTLVFLSALLTGLNLYNKLARFGGAGTLVPITGFANAVVSPAIDFRSEGFVTGMAAKMFLIAGPVIVFGTLASVIYGVVLVLLG